MGADGGGPAARPHLRAGRARQAQSPARGDRAIARLRRRHGGHQRVAQALPGGGVQAVDVIGVRLGGPRFLRRGRPGQVDIVQFDVRERAIEQRASPIPNRCAGSRSAGAAASPPGSRRLRPGRARQAGRPRPASGWSVRQRMRRRWRWPGAPAGAQTRHRSRPPGVDGSPANRFRQPSAGAGEFRRVVAPGRRIAILAWGYCRKGPCPSACVKGVFHATIAPDQTAGSGHAHSVEAL